MHLRRLLSKQWVSYGAIIALSSVLSAGGLFTAIEITKNKADAGRGGSLAVILAFWILFLGRNYGERTYQAIIDSLPSIEQKLQGFEEDNPVIAFSNDEATTILLALSGRLNVQGDEQKTQNRAFFFATFIGSLFSIFGDKFYDDFPKLMDVIHRLPKH